jgi:hypothetical protein
MARRCERSGNALPARSRRDRRFCSDRCRLSACPVRADALVDMDVRIEEPGDAVHSPAERP